MIFEPAAGFMYWTALQRWRSFAGRTSRSKGLFRLTVGPRVEQLRKNSRSGEVSAYGEMVGLLWTAGRFTAAMALEDMWNDVLRSTGSKLFCGYPIDVFGRSFHTCDVDALLSSHTHFVPADTSHALEQAVFRAMREVLPESAGDLEPRIKAETKAVWAKTLPGEALILWVRQHLSEQADEILGLAQRHYAIGDSDLTSRQSLTATFLPYPRRVIYNRAKRVIVARNSMTHGR